MRKKRNPATANITEIETSQKRRLTQARLSGVATLAVKGITTVASIVTIPLLLKYLGVEKFGIWLILSTFLNWISIADLGLANSLTNILAAADAQGDRVLGKKSVSSAVWLMTFISVTSLILFGCIYPFIQWKSLFNVSTSEAVTDIGASIAVSFILFALRLTLSVPGFIYRAYQDGFIYQLWCGLGSLLSIIFLIIAVNFHASLPLLICAFWGTILLGDIFAGFYLFGFQRPWLIPKLKDFDWSIAKNLFRMGFQFWIAQICAIIIFQTDLIIIDQLFGTEEVASYGVTLRLFAIIIQITTSFTMPLWPAYCEAFAKDDIPWVVKIFKKSVSFSLIFSVGSCILLLVFSKQIFTLLASQEMTPNLALMFSMFFTTVLNSVAQCGAALVNGSGELKLQSFIAPVSAIANLILSVILGHLLGTAGVSLATGICILTFSVGIVSGNGWRRIQLRGKQIDTANNA